MERLSISWCIMSRLVAEWVSYATGGQRHYREQPTETCRLAVMLGQLSLSCSAQTWDNLLLGLSMPSRRLGMGHDYATPTPISCCGSCEVRERDAAARGCRERSPVPSRVAACWTASRAPRLTAVEDPATGTGQRRGNSSARWR